jgi:group I intron endonuclease
MEKSGIYKITNRVNGKIYIGSAKSVSHRLSEHKWYLKNNNHENPHLQNAVNKYGLDNFDFSILEDVEQSKLLEREQYYLDLYKSYEEETGYNIRRKAKSNLGLKHSKETIRKISENNKGKNLGKHLGKDNPFFGKKHLEETKQKLRRKRSIETRKKISECRKGMHLSEETKRKMSQSLKGKKPWNKGIPQTEETKEKIKQLALKRYRKI